MQQYITDKNITGEDWSEIELDGFTQKYHSITGDRLFVKTEGDFTVEVLPASPGAEKHGFGWGFNVYSTTDADLFATSHNETYASPKDANVEATAILDDMIAEG